MGNALAVAVDVRTAWSPIAAPPAEDLRYMEWACGEKAWRAFVGIAPVDVDISSPAFLGCTPLLDLPAGAAAAYLGTYLLSLLEGLRLQEAGGVFHDVLTRAHVLYCLSDAGFWRDVIRPHLPLECQTELVEVCAYLAASRDLLALPQEQVDRILVLSKTDLPTPC
jgi:hypothetical protein